MAVKPVPDGYHTITPYIVAKGAAKLIDFMKEAFGAEELSRMGGPDGNIGHAEMRIGDSVVMLGDAASSASGEAQTAMLYLYVPDADALYKRALAAGATSLQEPIDHFYGDRSGAVKDAFGNQWWLATHVEDVSPEEMQKRLAAMRG